MAFIKEVLRSSAAELGTHSINLGTKYEVDDLLLVYVGVNSNSASTASAGWTLEIAQPGSMRGGNYQAFYKVAASTSETLQITTAAAADFLLLVIGDADTTTPIDDSDVINTNISTATRDCPAVTTTGTDTLVLRLAGTDRSESLYAQDRETLDEVGYSGDVGNIVIYQETVAAAGSTGTRTILSSIVDSLSAATIAIKNKAGSINQHNISVPWSYILSFYSWDVRNAAQSFNTNLSTLISTYNGFTVANVTASISGVPSGTQRGNAYDIEASELSATLEDS
jgi:hypothetical protein